MQEPYDGQVLRYHQFRRRYGITLRELSYEMGVSQQRISEIELCCVTTGLRTRTRLTDALESVILRRAERAAAALMEFDMIRAHLFEEVKQQRE